MYSLVSISLLSLMFTCSCAQNEYELDIYSTKRAKEFMRSIQDEGYNLIISKGFNDGTGTAFNTVMQSFTTDDLMESATVKFGFSNPMKVQFVQQEVSAGTLVEFDSTKSDEFRLGSKMVFAPNQIDGWASHKGTAGKATILNNGKKMYNVVLFSKVDDDYKPFYVSKKLLSKSTLEGVPVVKLSLDFETTVTGTFIGKITSPNFIVDLTDPQNKDVCIDKGEDGELDNLVFSMGKCS